MEQAQTEREKQSLLTLTVLTVLNQTKELFWRRHMVIFDDEEDDEDDDDDEIESTC